MIVGVVGLPGSGKTLFSIALLKQARKEGYRCFANFTSVNGSWERVDWNYITNLSNAFVVIDEAHMWFSSRNWKQQTQDELAVFQQHRKAGLELVWIAQHENRVDVALRELTAFYYRVSLLGGALGVAIKYEPDTGAILKRHLFYPKRYYNEYFTEERVLGRNEFSDEPVVGVPPNRFRFVNQLTGKVRFSFEPSTPEPLEICTHIGYHSPLNRQTAWVSLSPAVPRERGKHPQTTNRGLQTTTNGGNNETGLLNFHNK